MSVYTLDQSIAGPGGMAALHKAALRVLEQCMRTTGQYAVEVNAHDAAALRKHMTDLADQLEQSFVPSDYDKLHASFRGELRQYRDKSVRELSRMRSEMAAAAAVLQNLAESVASAGSGHEENLRQEVARLREAARESDLEKLRAVVAGASQALLESCEEMQRAHRAMVAQLRDEIRALHLEVEKERRAALTDPHTGVWNRGKLDDKVKDLMLTEQAFCVFFIGVSNLKHALARHPADRIKDALKAMLGRLASMVGDDGTAGRWSDDVFAVIFDVPMACLPVTQRELQFRLDGKYAVQDNGKNHLVDLAVKTAAVERPKGAREAEFYPRLSQAVASVAVE